MPNRVLLSLKDRLANEMRRGVPDGQDVYRLDLEVDSADPDGPGSLRSGELAEFSMAAGPGESAMAAPAGPERRPASN